MRLINYLKKKQQLLSEETPFNLIPGPANYIQGENLISKAGKYCCFLGKSAIIICDNLIYKKYYSVLEESLRKSGILCGIFIFSGECCLEEVEQICSFAREKAHDFVIGMGGGKTLDTAKLTSKKMQSPLALIATSAATCSAFTNVAIVYSKQGVYKDIVDIGKCADLTLVDETAMKDGPRELLIAGIGDSFAKYYEAKLAFSFKIITKDIFSRMGLMAAGDMMKVIKNSKKTNEIIAANIVLNGFVSTIGRESCSEVFAHAFTNGLSIVPESRKVLHGYLAALGVVFQQKLLKLPFKDKAFYKKCKLPLKFKDLKFKPDESNISRIANLIMNDDIVKYLYPDIKIERIIKALKSL